MLVLITGCECWHFLVCSSSRLLCNPEFETGSDAPLLLQTVTLRAREVTWEAHARAADWPQHRDLSPWLPGQVSVPNLTPLPAAWVLSAQGPPGPPNDLCFGSESHSCHKGPDVTTLSAQGAQCLPIAGLTCGWALPQRLAGWRPRGPLYAAIHPLAPAPGPGTASRRWVWVCSRFSPTGGNLGRPSTQRPPCDGHSPSTALSPHQVSRCGTSQQVRACWMDVWTDVEVFGGSVAAHLLFLPRPGNKA